MPKPHSSFMFLLEKATTGPNSLTFADARLVCTLASVLLIVALGASASSAQDWGSEPEVDRTSPAPTYRSTYASDDSPATNWSARAGIGFTADPESFLVNLEALYAFDQWVSAGPMMQLGFDDNKTIVAPSLNATVRVPDLPGDDFDALHPYGTLGMGFAYMHKDNRRNDNSSAGFMLNFGVGLEYEISRHLSLGSQMMFNFLPEDVLNENFFYSWQVGGIRVSF